MKFPLKGIFVFFFVCFSILGQAQKSPAINIEKGVSETLAAHRKKVLSNVVYKLVFGIPENKSDTIRLYEQIFFDLVKDQFPLQIDFKETADHITSVAV